MPQNKLQNWVNNEVKKNLDKEPFSSLPLKMRVGIFLLIGSFLIGYGLPPLIILIAGTNNELAAGTIGGSFFYLISWLPGTIGLVLAGKDSIKYPIYFFAKFLKILFPNYFNSSSRLSPFAITNIISALLILIFLILSVLGFSIYWLICIGVVIFVHQLLYVYGMFSSKSNYFFKTIKGKEYFNNKPGILFRFDDGPDPVYTPRILDILKAESVKALFAITGENAKKYPGIVKRIHEENHIIGNHTYSHPYNILLLSYKKIFGEISKTKEIIKEITGEYPVFFSPPMGQKNPIIGKVIRSPNLEPVMWDIRTGDTHFSTKKNSKINTKKNGITGDHSIS
jgi:hypothetical protein